MDNQLYWSKEYGMMYYITWEETGNNDIPTRHFLRDRKVVKSIRGTF